MVRSKYCYHLEDYTHCPLRIIVLDPNTFFSWWISIVRRCFMLPSPAKLMTIIQFCFVFNREYSVSKRFTFIIWGGCMWSNLFRFIINTTGPLSISISFKAPRFPHLQIQIFDMLVILCVLSMITLTYFKMYSQVIYVISLTVLPITKSLTIFYILW